MRRCLLGVICCLLSASAFAGNYKYTDSHVHLVDFFQETGSIQELIKSMDDAKIDYSVVFGIPVAKHWDEDEPRKPRYFAGDDANVYWYSATDDIVHDAVSAASKENKKRLLPFLTGFNPTDMHAANQIEARIKRQPGFWQGIGEVFLRHDDVTALTPGATPRANNEAMMRVYEVAAKYKLPVLLHSNITSKRERKPIYLPEIEEALEQNPKVNFIWAHGGNSKEIERHQGKLDFLHKDIKSLLNQYDNLYIDLSWALLENYLLTDDKPSQKWVDLVTEYPEHFVLGSDVVGKFSSQGELVHAFDKFLDALPADTAKLVARDNMLQLTNQVKHNQGKHKNK